MTHAHLLTIGLGVVVGLTAVGCATRRPAPEMATAEPAAAETTAAPATTSRRMLLSDEIRVANVTTAHDAVSRLRPEWLRRRGQISMRQPDAGEVVIYLNGMRYGDPTLLHRIAAASVVDMQFLSGTEATTRYGTGHGGGVILVRTQ